MSVLFETNGLIAVATLSGFEKDCERAPCETLENMAQAFSRLSKDSNLRVVILDGAHDTGTSFIIDEERAEQALQCINTLCDAIKHCRVPVIAVVSGFASGVELELILACHLRVVSETAEFDLLKTNLNLASSHNISQKLARIVGSERANELLLMEKTIKAHEALRAGLANRVAPPEQVRHEAMTLAQEITKLAPLAVQACLQAVTQGFDLSLEEGLKLETELFSGLCSTEDMREGTGAFLEKRQPDFQGR